MMEMCNINTKKSDILENKNIINDLDNDYPICLRGNKQYNYNEEIVVRSNNY
jgi:hypothetical protein